MSRASGVSNLIRSPNMATRLGPRSATDATRFTSTTPQPRSKAPEPKTGPAGETLEQRMQRLRAAHLAARNAPLSTYDRIVGGSRHFFDASHKIIVTGMVLGTVVAGIFSLYAVFDMMKFNKIRRAEFIEVQRRMEEDELAQARIAFMNGTATEEQASLVERALKVAEEKGYSLPPLLSTARPSAPPAEERTVFQQIESQLAEAKAEETHAGNMDQIKQKAQEAFEKEKENQRKGGMLDRMGSVTQQTPPGSGTLQKSSWWRWW